jgi:uncharacterized protein YbcI
VAKYLRVFRHVGFFCFTSHLELPADGERMSMDSNAPSMAQQLADAARAFQLQQTGRAPTTVSVVISEDTLVVTLHDALSPAEQVLARSREGAANLREYHQQLFRNSVGSLRTEIERITGRKVREAAAEVDPGTGSVVHAFTTGTTVQVFLLDGGLKQGTHVPSDAAASAVTSEVLYERFGDEGTSH